MKTVGYIGFFVSMLSLVLWSCSTEKNAEPWMLIYIQDESLKENKWSISLCDTLYEVRNVVTMFYKECEGSLFLSGENGSIRSENTYVTPGVPVFVMYSVSDNGISQKVIYRRNF